MRQLRPVRSLILTVVLSSMAFVFGSMALAHDVQITPDVVYGHKYGMALTLDLFQPEQGARGVGVLFMVSGGWYSHWSPPEKSLDFFQPLTDKGFTVFAIRHGSSPKFSIPEAVADVRRSVRFIRHNATRFGIDPDRLGVYGGSAGGHLALMLGTASDPGDPKSIDPVLRTSDRVQAVVALVPPTDLRIAVWKAPNHLPVYEKFPALDLDLKAAAEYSPLVHVTPDDPPTLLMVGAKDQLVPIRHSQQIDAAFRRNHVEDALIVFENSGHGFHGEDSKQATARLVAWFERHLKPIQKPHAAAGVRGHAGPPVHASDRRRAKPRVSGPTPAPRHDAKTVHWYDARALTIEGKGWRDTKAFYDRLPAKAEGVVRPAVWSLSHHSAGVSVRFRTDAPSIDVRWQLTSGRLAMPHMAATGVSGVDLYVRTDRGWHWLATGKPRKQVNTAHLIANLPVKVRDYWLYLPLYNGVARVEIGVPAASTIEESPPRNAAHQKPLVFWGTSITQGGCASRPGMVHTAILGRRLDRPVINLGFSGNGRMEPEVARLIGEIDAAVYVIDCLPNLTGAEVAERVEHVVQILRKAHPNTPILLVEDRTYADAFLVAGRKERNTGSRAALKAAYQRMTAAGVKGLYYLPGDQLLGNDGEDTVDGSHPTDLGFFRQAAAFEQSLRLILAGANR